MKVGLYRAATGDSSRLCLVASGHLVDVANAMRVLDVTDPRENLIDLSSLLESGERGRNILKKIEDAVDREGPRPDFASSLEDARLLAPFVPSSKILCHVINYVEHGDETEIDPPERPFFFYKPSSSVIGPGDPIIEHRSSNQVDYEVELGAVIGRRGRDIPPDRAYEYIAGYTIVNDVSYRDLQFVSATPSLRKRYGMDWTCGKGLDNSCPIGPWITLSDELPAPYPLRLRCWVNDELRQDAATTDQIFRVPELVSFISRGMTLHPGDVLATGTPSGIGMTSNGFLHDGDIVRCEIEGIGVLANPVVADPAGRAADSHGR